MSFPDRLAACAGPMKMPMNSASTQKAVFEVTSRMGVPTTMIPASAISTVRLEPIQSSSLRIARIGRRPSRVVHRHGRTRTQLGIAVQIVVVQRFFKEE